MFGKIMSKINVKIYVLIFFSTYVTELRGKSFDQKVFTCADEVGPRLEFEIPKFGVLTEANFTFKIFKINERKSFTIKKGIIKKISSPIDNSYFFYKANSNDKQKDNFEITFEFYPPSHLLIQHFNSPFTDLVCWN